MTLTTDYILGLILTVGADAYHFKSAKAVGTEA